MIGMEITIIDILTIILGIIIPILATKYRKEFKLVIEKIVQLGRIVYIVDELEDIQSTAIMNIKDMLIKLKKGEDITDEEIGELIELLHDKLERMGELREALRKLREI